MAQLQPGNEITACGAGGVVTVSANQAQCATSALSEATHTITAVYSGDATYNGVTNTVQQVIAKNATSTASFLLRIPRRRLTR